MLGSIEMIRNKMKEEHLVSVVMPVYNAEKYLEACINSILEQTHTNIQLIAVDDGSTDGSRAILERYADRIQVKYQNNSGPARARNCAIGLAHGKYIAFIDNDDIWEPDKLIKQVMLLERYPNVVATYCDIKRISDSGIVTSETDLARSCFPSGQSFGTLLFSDSSISTPSQVMVRREALWAVGGFQEKLRRKGGHYDDWLLWIKLALLGPFVFLPEALTLYRRHEMADSVHADADYQRSIGRLDVYLEVKLDVKEIQIQYIEAAYKQSVYDAALNLGYFAGMRRDLRRSIRAYKVAFMMKPYSIGVLKGVIVSILRNVFVNKK